MGQIAFKLLYVERVEGELGWIHTKRDVLIQARLTEPSIANILHILIFALFLAF